MAPKSGAEQAVRDIRRQTRKNYSAEEKVRIVLSGLRGEDSIAELCRREGIAVTHKPRLLSDNGASYIAGDLAQWLDEKGMDHVRGAPNHPQTQGKIERWHQTLKTESCWKTISCPAIWKPGSKPSSSITATADATKASAI